MITVQEWRQIATALSHAGLGRTDEYVIMNLQTVFDILRPFTVEGCSAVVEKDWTVSINYKKEQ